MSERSPAETRPHSEDHTTQKSLLAAATTLLRAGVIQNTGPLRENITGAISLRSCK